ncbi:MAG: hypothetical protein ACTHMU_05820, partial [Thermomicrobiales bacterium]
EIIVRRLFTDAEFRGRALAEPGTALAEYRLAAEEQIALIRLCAQLAGGGLRIPGPSVVWW